MTPERLRELLAIYGEPDRYWPAHFDTVTHGRISEKVKRAAAIPVARLITEREIVELAMFKLERMADSGE